MDKKFETLKKKMNEIIEGEIKNYVSQKIEPEKQPEKQPKKAFSNSKILLKDDYPFMNKKMFDKPFETELIYRASEDGFGWKEARAKI